MDWEPLRAWSVAEDAKIQKVGAWHFARKPGVLATLDATGGLVVHAYELSSEDLTEILKFAAGPHGRWGPTDVAGEDALRWLLDGLPRWTLLPIGVLDAQTWLGRGCSSYARSSEHPLTPRIALGLERAEAFVWEAVVVTITRDGGPPNFETSIATKPAPPTLPRLVNDLGERLAEGLWGTHRNEVSRALRDSNALTLDEVASRFDWQLQRVGSMCWVQQGCRIGDERFRVVLYGATGNTSGLEVSSLQGRAVVFTGTEWEPPGHFLSWLGIALKVAICSVPSDQRNIEDVMSVAPALFLGEPVRTEDELRTLGLSEEDALVWHPLRSRGHDHVFFTHRAPTHSDERADALGLFMVAVRLTDPSATTVVRVGP